MARLNPPLMLFLLALLLRVGVALLWRFDGLYGQDAFAYYRQGVAIAANAPRGQAPPADFFWPNGYPFLIALFTTIFGPTALAAQLPSLLLGAALAPLIYALSIELLPQYGHRAGLVAGLIVAVAGQPILSSVSAMADMPALFWATLSVWLLVRRQKAEGGRQMETASGMMIGIVLGMAVVTRWLYVLLAPVIAVYVVYQAWRNSPGVEPFGGFLRRKRTSGLTEQPAKASTPEKRQLLVTLGLIALGGAMVTLPQLWLSLSRPEGLAHPWLLGWSPINALRRAFVTADGYQTYRLPPALYNLEPIGHPAFMFPLLGLAAVWGLIQLWRGRAWAVLILLGGWISLVYLFLAGIPYENFRFGLTLYPPLTILAGYGVADLLATRARRLVWAATALSLVGMLLWAGPMLNNFLTTQNGSKAIARQTEEMLPPGATLLTFGLTATLLHYTGLEVVELFYETPDTLRARVCGGRPTYALLDVQGIEAQWGEREPGIALVWLRAGPGLTPVAQWEHFTLFQVERRCS